jgi:hypothetical protein
MHENAWCANAEDRAVRLNISDDVRSKNNSGILFPNRRGHSLSSLGQGRRYLFDNIAAKVRLQ